MSELIRVTNYGQLLDLLLHQYKNSDNLKNTIKSVLDNANDLEQALFEIKDEFYLDVAAGDQLDVLGVVFGISREGRNDTEYREAIQQQAALQYSGEPESIIELVQAIFGGTFVEYSPQYPAKYNIYTDAVLLSRQLNPINPSGVTGFILKPVLAGNGNYVVDGQGNLVCSVIEVERVFILDGNNNTMLDGAGNTVIAIELVS